MVERHPEGIGDHLGVGRLTALAVGETPVSTVTVPVGSTRMEQLSHPPMPGGRKNDGPIPQIAIYDARPIPR